jgi:hypothetical protein
MRKVLGSVSPLHFVQGDVPLIIAYCEAIVIERWAANLMGDENTDTLQALKAWEKATRLVATLATQLRLSPQSRMHARTAARKADDAAAYSRPPWEGYEVE